MKKRLGLIMMGITLSILVTSCSPKDSGAGQPTPRTDSSVESAPTEAELPEISMDSALKFDSEVENISFSYPKEFTASDTDKMVFVDCDYPLIAGMIYTNPEEEFSTLDEAKEIYANDGAEIETIEVDGKQGLVTKTIQGDKFANIVYIIEKGDGDFLTVNFGTEKEHEQKYSNVLNEIVDSISFK